MLDDRGVLMQGKRADSCSSTATRRRDIADIRKVALVVKGDKAYYPSEIDDALGIKPFAPPLKVQAVK